MSSDVNGAVEPARQNGGLDDSASKQGSAALVAAENTRPGLELRAALDACARFDGHFYFQNRRENRVALFVVAYKLLLEMVRGGEEALTLAIERFPPGIRQRAPSRDKRELIALQLTAKPETESQRKVCSDYASVLVVARAQGLSAREFEEWVGDVRIEDCKAQAKKIREALKAKAPSNLDEEPEPATAPPQADGTTTSKPSQEPRLEVQLIGKTGVEGTLSLALNERAYPALLQLFRDQPFIRSDKALLQSLIAAVELADIPLNLGDDEIRF